MVSPVLPTWRTALLASLEANKHNRFSTYFQLATVRPDGKPSNRTVVFRGFVGESDDIQFWTDTRSDKVEDIEHNAWGEMCWYFVDSWQQYRVAGTMNVIKAEEKDPKRAKLRADSWFGLSPRQRIQFANPPPKMPRAPEHYFPSSVDVGEGPLETYGLVTLHPQTIDYVHLKENKRVIHRKSAQANGSWTEENVNP